MTFKDRFINPVTLVSHKQIQHQNNVSQYENDLKTYFDQDKIEMARLRQTTELEHEEVLMRHILGDV